MTLLLRWRRLGIRSLPLLQKSHWHRTGHSATVIMYLGEKYFYGYKARNLRLGVQGDMYLSSFSGRLSGWQAGRLGWARKYLGTQATTRTRPWKRRWSVLTCTLAQSLVLLIGREEGNRGCSLGALSLGGLGGQPGACLEGTAEDSRVPGYWWVQVTPTGKLYKAGQGSWLSHVWKPENGSGFKVWQMYGMVWYLVMVVYE